MNTPVLFLLALTCALYSESFSPFEGLSVNTGYAYSTTEKSAAGIDLSGCAIAYNASVECFYYQRDIEDKRFSTRAYMGLGLGPNLQVQGGFGNGGLSLRLRSTIDLTRLLSDPGYILMFPAAGYIVKKNGEMRNSPVFSLFGEALNREFRVGALFGILLW